MDSHDSPRKSREKYCRPARRKPSPRVRKRSPSRPRAERRRGSPRILPSLRRRKNAKQRTMGWRESGQRGDPPKLPGRKLPEQSPPRVSAFASSRDLGKSRDASGLHRAGRKIREAAGASPIAFTWAGLPGSTGFPARTQAVYQRLETNEAPASSRFSASGPASL